MSGGHSLLSPSSAPRWMRCSGSVALSYGAPDESSEYADEGTAAHQLASATLDAVLSGSKITAHDSIGKPIHVMNDDGTIRRTFVVDDDMADNVQAYIDAVLREPGEKFIEIRVDYSHVVGVEGQKGTADAVTVDTDAHSIRVTDLKFGRGVPVFAEYEDNEGNRRPNEQLALYALGALHEYEMLDEFKTITLGIHQPRRDHYDESTWTVEELKEWGKEAGAWAARAMEGFIIDKEEGTLTPRPVEELELSPGNAQCRFCKGAAVCPGLQQRNERTVFEQFDDVSGPTPKEVDDLPLAALPLPEDLELLEVFLTAARSRIQRELQAGREVHGWKLVKGKRGARRWLAERKADIEKLLTSRRSGIKKADAYKPKEIISPTQAEKLLAGNKKFWAILQEHITQSEGGEHVAPADDPREAIVKLDVAAALADDSDLL